MSQMKTRHLVREDTRNTYNGDEVTDVITPDGELIVEVCTRFFKVLSMEGTGRLKDRGQEKR